MEYISYLQTMSAFSMSVPAVFFVVFLPHQYCHLQKCTRVDVLGKHTGVTASNLPQREAGGGGGGGRD